MEVIKMKKDTQVALSLGIGILFSVAIAAVMAIFYSFVNMYVWNNVVLYFFELSPVALVGGFGIEVMMDAFLTKVVKRSEDTSAFESLLHAFLYRATVLLLAWIFTLFV